ncbi:glutathione S-transferase family protein [Vitreimonas flagellata]|uniref:glutathione S-transferase family protein n=1 Tax=Vitreimonas flagellata TaxID=2560861 RepID=UPI001075122C|nr:glutathione S-transferase family protein [Vitreimonas flagellata]
MTITITVFGRAFDEGRGLARDMRVRWALEEVGQAYEVRLVPWEKFKAEAHLARNPFGQIPTYEEGDLTLFESGAIVLHIAERFPGLLPKDADARARAIMWMFAALSTVEPPIVDRDVVEYAEAGKSWQGERFAMVDGRIRDRLAQLSARMGDGEWLDGDFSAADIIMVHVLRRLEGSGLLEEFPVLAAYIARAEKRPAYQRAFAAQLALWENRAQ